MSSKLDFLSLRSLTKLKLPTTVSAPKPTKTQANTGASAPKPARIQVLTAKPKQRRNKRATVSPTSARRGKKSRSEQSLPHPLPLFQKAKIRSWKNQIFPTIARRNKLYLRRHFRRCFWRVGCC
ncbi:hypothetical protein TNCT_291111 [Trichonephila clavata]|uniref:Uncharacterized protein n=1 Tax=Trichonephila clavata TaxID=2740835 RepID=A0A8X6J4Z7_TRICU|nr:hypothetical protein TNCT_291111 [Trichonephila clavata]